MIVPAAAANTSKQKAPTHVADSGSDIDESTDLEESDSDSCEMEHEPESESSNIDEDRDPIKVLRATSKSLSPPVAEESVLGKWYAVVHSTKHAGQLFVTKIMKHFLVDGNGPADSLKFRCLKPNVGPDTLLDDTPQHLPDICMSV